MPNIYAMVKNHVIEREEEIPEEYRKKIEKRLTSVNK